MRARGLRLWAGTICLSAATAVVIVGCGALDESPPTRTPAPSPTNLLVDPGFERGIGWTAPSLLLDTENAHSGKRSVRLSVSGPLGSADGAMQSVITAEFPEFLSGFYRVDTWPGSDAYLQFTVYAPSGAFEAAPEIRFIIAGSDSAPDPSLAPAVFLSRAAPVTGEWTYFAYPLRQAFLDKVAAIPATWASVDVSLEVRSGGDSAEATAYFDDIYLGKQIGNPNRPNQSTR